MAEEKKEKEVRVLKGEARFACISTAILLGAIMYFVVLGIIWGGPHSAEYSRDIGQYYTNLEISNDYNSIRESLIDLRGAIDENVSSDSGYDWIWVREEHTSRYAIKEIDAALDALYERVVVILDDADLTEHTIGALDDIGEDNLSSGNLGNVLNSITLNINHDVYNKIQELYNDVKGMAVSHIDNELMMLIWEKENHYVVFMLLEQVAFTVIFMVSGILSLLCACGGWQMVYDEGFRKTIRVTE